MKKILLVASVLFLAGCKTPVPASYTFKTFPDIGELSTAGVGDRLLQQGLGVSVSKITLSGEQVIGDFTVLPGAYIQTARNTEYTTFANVLMKKGVEGRIQDEELFMFEKDKGTDVLCVSRRSCAPVTFKLEQHTIYSPTSMQQTLLYNGRIGERITLSYREFSNDIARSAFTNEVIYDLSESAIVGYKGARLEVIKATNTEIKYKVLSGFDK